MIPLEMKTETAKEEFNLHPNQCFLEAILYLLRLTHLVPVLHFYTP